MTALGYIATPADIIGHIGEHTCLTAPPVLRKPDPRHSRKPAVPKAVHGGTAWRRRYGW